MEHFIIFTLVIAAESFLVKSSLQYHLPTEKCSLIKRRHFSFFSNFHAYFLFSFFLHCRTINLNPAISCNSDWSSKTETAYCRVSFSKPYPEFLTNFRIGSSPHANIVFCSLRCKHWACVTCHWPHFQLSSCPAFRPSPVSAVIKD